MNFPSSVMWVPLSPGDEFDFSAAGMLQTKNDYKMLLGTKLKADSKPWLTRNINPSKFFIAYDFVGKAWIIRKPDYFKIYFKNYCAGHALGSVQTWLCFLCVFQKKLGKSLGVMMTWGITIV